MTGLGPFTLFGTGIYCWFKTLKLIITVFEKILKFSNDKKNNTFVQTLLFIVFSRRCPKEKSFS